VDDFKFLAVFLVAPLAFWAFGSNLDFSGAEFQGLREIPTITFVDPDTPGALTAEEYTQGGYWKYDADYGRYDQ